MQSPVAIQALDKGFPSDLIFTPVRAGEVINCIYVLNAWSNQFN